MVTYDVVAQESTIVTPFVLDTAVVFAMVTVLV